MAKKKQLNETNKHLSNLEYDHEQTMSRINQFAYKIELDHLSKRVKILEQKQGIKN